MSDPTFADLGLSEPIVRALADRGIPEPFPIQSMSIPDAITGRDICGKAKTGSGKTFAFGLPVLHQLAKAEPRRPRALALVPTRELAVQVHDELAPIGEELDRTIGAIYGGADIEKQIKKLRKGVDFVVATPGRLIDLIERTEVSLDDIEHVIVDEADRMADMGFMPQVEWVLRHVHGEHQTLLFSATLDGVVDRLVSRYQNDPARFEVESKTTTVDSMQHRRSLRARTGPSRSAAPSTAPIDWSRPSTTAVFGPQPFTATFARRAASGPSKISPTARSKCSSRPTWPPVAFMSTTSTS